MAPRSAYIEATIAATVCTIREWHPTTKCKNPEEEEIQRFRKLKSDLFKPHECDLPAPQKEIMNRNYSTSPLLRLPPELRVRIYGFVLGGQQLWISHSDSKVEWKTPETQIRLWDRRLEEAGQYFHRCGRFFHFTADHSDSTSPFNGVLHLGLLRVCRHIYTETALLPYALNTFTFRDDSIRRLFERSARPGKKRVQKKAIGKYEIGTWLEFRGRHMAGQGTWVLKTS